MNDHLKEYARRRLDEACKENDSTTIRYWVGYLDALEAVEREEKKDAR